MSESAAIRRRIEHLLAQGNGAAASWGGSRRAPVRRIAHRKRVAARGGSKGGLPAKKLAARRAVARAVMVLTPLEMKKAMVGGARIGGAMIGGRRKMAATRRRRGGVLIDHPDYEREHAPRRHVMSSADQARIRDLDADDVAESRSRALAPSRARAAMREVATRAGAPDAAGAGRPRARGGARAKSSPYVAALKRIAKERGLTYGQAMKYAASHGGWAKVVSGGRSHRGGTFY